MKIENFEEYNRLKFPAVKAVVCVILSEGDKILLTKRSIEPGKGLWCLPGGHIEIGETAVEAVLRETREETGFEVSNLKFLFYQDEFLPEIKQHAVLLVFSGKQSGKFVKNCEVSEIGFFSKRDIVKMDIAFKHLEVINKYYGN